MMTFSRLASCGRGSSPPRVSHPNIVEVYAVGEDERAPVHRHGARRRARTLAAELAVAEGFPPRGCDGRGGGIVCAGRGAQSRGRPPRRHAATTSSSGWGKRRSSPTSASHAARRHATDRARNDHGHRRRTLRRSRRAARLSRLPQMSLARRGPLRASHRASTVRIADTVPGLLLQSASGRVVAPSKLVSGISRPLEDTVLRMLATAPENRPSAAALAETLPGSLGGAIGRRACFRPTQRPRCSFRPRRSSARRPVLRTQRCPPPPSSRSESCARPDSGSPGPSPPPVHHASVFGPVGHRHRRYPHDHLSCGRRHVPFSLARITSNMAKGRRKATRSTAGGSGDG